MINVHMLDPTYPLDKDLKIGCRFQNNLVAELTFRFQTPMIQLERDRSNYSLPLEPGSSFKECVCSNNSFYWSSDPAFNITDFDDDSIKLELMDPHSIVPGLPLELICVTEENPDYPKRLPFELEQPRRPRKGRTRSFNDGTTAESRSSKLTVSQMNMPMSVGIPLLTLLVLVGVAGGFCWHYKEKRLSRPDLRRSTSEDPSEVELDSTGYLKPRQEKGGFFDPILGRFQSTKQQSNGSELAKLNQINMSLKNLIELPPLEDDNELIPGLPNSVVKGIDCLEVGSLIDGGNFGHVYRGYLKEADGSAR